MRYVLIGFLAFGAAAFLATRTGSMCSGEALYQPCRCGLTL